MLLEVHNLSVSYGPIAAVRDVSLNVGEGEIVAVLGANGAGKTTLLWTLSGLLRPRHGSAFLEGREVTRMPAHAVARAGIAHVPEGRGILRTLTVLENLRLGAYGRRDSEVKHDLDELLERFPILAERRGQLAGLLSGGQQQIVAIARGWMAKPKLMLLDEPSMGLAPLLVAEIFRMIGALRDRCSVLLVEQNTRAALRLADRAYVMQLGRLVLDGPAETLLSDEHLVHAYLGGQLPAPTGRGPG